MMMVVSAAVAVVVDVKVAAGKDEEVVAEVVEG